MESLQIVKISNGYILKYYNATWQERYFETKAELFKFIDEIML